LTSKLPSIIYLSAMWDSIQRKCGVSWWKLCCSQTLSPHAPRCYHRGPLGEYWAAEPKATVSTLSSVIISWKRLRAVRAVRAGEDPFHDFWVFWCLLFLR
jgi:hypothetical protein